MKKITYIITIAVFFLAPRLCRAQQDSSWKTHDLHGIQLRLPGFFKAGKENAYHTVEFGNSISKKISLDVECLIARKDFTPASLASYHDDCVPFFRSIKEDILTDSSFVLSGTSKTGTLLFIKGIKKGPSYFGLTLNYGKQYQQRLATKWSTIAESFR